MRIDVELGHAVRTLMHVVRVVTGRRRVDVRWRFRRVAAATVVGVVVVVIGGGHLFQLTEHTLEFGHLIDSVRVCLISLMMMMMIRFVVFLFGSGVQQKLARYGHCAELGRVVNRLVLLLLLLLLLLLFVLFLALLVI